MALSTPNLPVGGIAATGRSLSIFVWSALFVTMEKQKDLHIACGYQDHLCELTLI